jgi:NTE family protein
VARARLGRVQQQSLRTPDVLILGGGGILGEAWMRAVLAGLEEGADFDARGCGGYIGTSAGSIVAATLVAGVAPGVGLGDPPRPEPSVGPEPELGPSMLAQALGAGVGLAGAAIAPLASMAFASTSGGGALLRRALLRGVPAGRRSLAELGRMVESTGAAWDGRLLIAAVELRSGRRVMFGGPNAPDVTVAVAVQASCAIPGVFAPVAVGAEAYIDGGVWSPTNMDAAEVGRGDRVLCLNPTGSLRPTSGALAGALGPVSRSIAAAEALALRHRGAEVTAVNPDGSSSAAMGSDLMDPRRRAEVVVAGLAQGLRLAAEAPGRAA